MHRHWRSNWGRPYEAFYAKGHYYTLSGKSPFSRLIYPVAETGGLGVHVTLDISHQARFGPDVVWIDEDDYSFDSSQFDRFVDAIRRYYPDLDPTKLQPGYTGIRPKLAPSGIGVSDFVVNGPKETGIDGYIELLGYRIARTDGGPGNLRVRIRNGCSELTCGN